MINLEQVLQAIKAFDENDYNELCKKLKIIIDDGEYYYEVDRISDLSECLYNNKSFNKACACIFASYVEKSKTLEDKYDKVIEKI